MEVAAIQLIAERAATSRNFLEDRVGRREECQCGLVHVELLMNELLHPARSS